MGIVHLVEPSGSFSNLGDHIGDVLLYNCPEFPKEKTWDIHLASMHDQFQGPIFLAKFLLRRNPSLVQSSPSRYLHVSDMRLKRNPVCSPNIFLKCICICSRMLSTSDTIFLFPTINEWIVLRLLRMLAVQWKNAISSWILFREKQYI